MIKIMTTEFCPYCVMAKQLLKSKGYKYEEIDVTTDREKMMEVVSITGMMTVPQIFAGEINRENLLGGYDDIAALDSAGKLESRLKL